MVTETGQVRVLIVNRRVKKKIWRNFVIISPYSFAHTNNIYETALRISSSVANPLKFGKRYGLGLPIAKK